MLHNNYLFLDIMDEKKSRIEKIYSRNNIKIPKIKTPFSWHISFNENKHNTNVKRLRKIIKILTVLVIAFLVADTIVKAIEPIITKQCINMAKSIATKVSNEQATIVMADYNYTDLMNITKDESGNIKMISANVITVNKIISDIPILIQDALSKSENNKFHIKLGSFTGSKMLAGRGPDIDIKMTAIGNVETDLKSEFSQSGINQTLHRVYLEVKCNVIILTPFNSIEQQIVNQVLLAEGVIVGNIPDAYYNLEGINNDNLVDIIE